MKKYFITGLLIWIPLAITVWVLTLIVQTMDQSLLLLPQAIRPERLLGIYIPGIGALLTILVTDDLHLVLAASAVFGFSVGNLITLPPLIIHREFEATSFTVVMGLFTAISGTVGAFGPGLLGVVRGWSGDYAASLLLAIALEVVAAAIVVGWRRQRKTKDAS